MSKRERPRQVATEVEPRLLSTGDAARYCGVSEPLFLREVGVKPLRLGGRVLWDREGLDAWIDIIGVGSQEGMLRHLTDGEDATSRALEEIRARNAGRKSKRRIPLRSRD